MALREIKFRGKYVGDGEWVYGDLIHKRHTDDVVLIQDDKGLGSDVWPDTVGQYTGLKDANGKEIYEGDIVKVHDTPFNLSAIGVVIYYPETARFLIREQNKKYPRVFSFRKHDAYNDGHCTVECISDFHVLGNIHDNPELL